MVKIPFITPLVDFLSEMGSKFIELQKVKAEGRILVETTRAKAEATVLVTKAQSVADWERVQAENSGTSWKDEFWTLLIAAPIPFVFFEGTRQFIIEGFHALNTVPEWYLWTIAASVSASFGIRSGLFERIGGVLGAKEKK
jgi:hypothetical protein